MAAPEKDEDLIVMGVESPAAEWIDGLWLNGATLDGFTSYNIYYVTETAMGISFTFEGAARPTWTFGEQSGVIDGTDDVIDLGDMTQTFDIYEIWGEPEIVVDEDGTEVVGKEEVVGYEVRMHFELKTEQFA